MPGVVSSLSIAVGQTVKAGDLLLSIETMEMETALHAERHGGIAEVLIKSGDQIEEGFAGGVSLRICRNGHALQVHRCERVILRRFVTI